LSSFFDTFSPVLSSSCSFTVESVIGDRVGHGGKQSIFSTPAKSQTIDQGTRCRS
jgi:hypothetical protein